MQRGQGDRTGRRRNLDGLLALGAVLLSGMAWILWGGGVRLATRAMLGRSSVDREELTEFAGEGGRRDRRDGRGGIAAPSTPLPPEVRVPSNAAELAEFVAWMRALGPDELLRLSNAEFDFESSELIERLQGLEGAWVVQALGDLAVAESDPLLKAVLVKGLLGAPNPTRWGDEALVPILDSLLATMTHASDDPHGVAQDLATAVLGASACQGLDYVTWMKDFLAASDDPGFLLKGYLHMGLRDGGGALLSEMLTSHADENGRMGALEGLRGAVTSGRLSPEEATRLGMEALENETNERNRLLLYEMVIAVGGPEGLDRIEEALRAGQVGEITKAAELLAMKLEPARAQALFQDLLRGPGLETEAREAVYRALGLVPGQEGEDLLLGVARDESLGQEERLAGLRGLWSRTKDARLLGELQAVFDSARDPELRKEALRMMAFDGDDSVEVDYRAIAALDEDPSVRAEAVQLAAMRPESDVRPWLEERLFGDDSLEVKAAALGALVLRAHYSGDGEDVLGYLDRARRFTSDPSTLAMIAEGERMVKDHDPRNLDLGLAEEAAFWSSIAPYADGPAALSFQRRARQLSGIVAGLRMGQGVSRAVR